MRTLGDCPVSSLRFQQEGAREELLSLFEHPAEKITAEIQKAHIDALGRSIARIEQHVHRNARALPHFNQLMGIPGIGKILAMTIVLEVGDIDRFPSPEDFASYCRMVKAVRNSNGKKKSENNRKCGNRYLAWAFIEAANFICRFDARAQRWRDRKAAKTNPIVARKALGCKIAKTVWHILSHGSEYDGERLFGPTKSSNTAAASASGQIPGEHPPARNRG